MKAAELLVKAIVAGLQNDDESFRKIAFLATRALRKDNPEGAEIIANVLAHADAGAGPLRAFGIEPSPVDYESNLELAKIIDTPICDEPILNNSVQGKIDIFLRHYKEGGNLALSGITPPSSLLLVGPSGVGKTLLATHIAKNTAKKLVVLDLASIMSSLLGKTGHNIRSVLNYARRAPCVLLLDEFDSIAKRRDDQSDLGELKRIVNILLKELEYWPIHSILVAATNHPHLLDSAIWRRFDEVIEVSLPDEGAREMLFYTKILKCENLIPLKPFVVEATKGLTPAEIIKIAEKINRRVVLEEMAPVLIAVDELVGASNKLTKKSKSAICKMIKNSIPGITLAEIGDLVGVNASTVCYHLRGKNYG